MEQIILISKKSIGMFTLIYLIYISIQMNTKKVWNIVKKQWISKQTLYCLLTTMQKYAIISRKWMKWIGSLINTLGKNIMTLATIPY
ncbi:hypothetical protein [Vallitalea guaymasensis]|uniref:hypothetical protein n=1 Tax=Vallitalea guaymasensis TaxID=1185412 RepID=UPI003AB95DDA